MSGQSFSGNINMVSVLLTICGLFLTGVVADLEGSSYVEVEEILLESEVALLRKHSSNLLEKIQIQDEQLRNMRNLEETNRKLTQQYNINMEKNQNLRAENIFQSNQVKKLNEQLQRRETILHNRLTKARQDLKNATEHVTRFESLLQAELQSKSTHEEDAHLERERHKITKQEFEDLWILVKMSTNLTRLQIKRTSKLEKITTSMDMKQTIKKMKEKEILYLADIQAYQNEIVILQNNTQQENDQKEKLRITMIQQGQLAESNERMVRFLTSVIVNMTSSIHNCSTIKTDAQQVQIDALLEKQEMMQQRFTQCNMFNATAVTLQKRCLQLTTDLKQQLGGKNNIIHNHFEENQKISNVLEETKQLTKIQSNALEVMTEEINLFIPDDINRRPMVRRNADGTIKSARVCQCIPEAPEASELELSSINWSCPHNKAVLRNNSQIENNISLPCTVSDCSTDESSWPKCEDVFQKSWTPWEYFNCKEIGMGNETILCGSGHRSKLREVRLSSAHPWRNDSVIEHCQRCSLSFASVLGGQKMTISPPALRNALHNSMEISNPTFTVVLEKSWTPWQYFSCKEISVGNDTTLCGNGHRFRSREVRSSAADPWRTEDITDQCQPCSLSFFSKSRGQQMSIYPPTLENALNNSMVISDPIPPIPCLASCSGVAAKLIIRDGTSNAPIENAAVIMTLIQDGISSSSIKSNSYGESLIPINKNGNYVVNVTAEGYMDFETTFTMECDISKCDLCNKTVPISLSPTIKKGEARVIMNWSENPKDLDLHILQVRRSSSNATCHLFYSNKNCPGFNLDVDNTSGGHNGAETVTFDLESQDNNFVYMVYVYNYNKDDQLGNSELRLTFSSTSGTLKEEMDSRSFSNQHYWMAGCLRFNGVTPEWKSSNNFLNADPSVQSPNLCLTQFEQ